MASDMRFLHFVSAESAFAVVISSAGGEMGRAL